MSHRTLCLAATLAVLAAAPAFADSTPPPAPALDAVHAAYVQQWDQAIAQSRSGDTLAAMIAMERLMDSPLLADFDAERRGRAAHAAGLTAAQQKQPALARRYLQQALQALPGDARILAAVASLALEEEQAPDIISAWVIDVLGQADGPLAIDHHAVSYLQNDLRDQPVQRMALLQALFDNGWKSGGVEPTALWLVLATLQADHGRAEAIPATLARIDSPAELIQLRSDKRFDRYVDRKDTRFDPVAAAQRQLDALRVSGLLDGGLDARMLEFGATLLALDRNDEVLALTHDLAAAAVEGHLAADQVEWVAWLLNTRMIALRRLGRIDDALAAAERAARLGMRGPDGIDHQMNVGFMLGSLGRLQDADAVTRALTELSDYGQAAQALLRFTAARERGDATAAADARAIIVAHGRIAPGFQREMLLEEGNLDAAAAVLIEQLRSPLERGDVLASLQALRVYPSLPGDVRADAAWRALTQRADVQAEVARVGRIERYDLVSTSTSR